MRSLMLVAWLCVLLVQSTQAIYEDQAGKFDWSVQNLGRVVAVAYGGGDKRSVSSATPSRGASKAAYVATDRRSRALARVDAKSGEIKWRHVLTVGDEIDAIELTNYGLLSVSGSGKFVRLWDIADGSLLWDNAVNAASAVQDVVVVGEDRALLVAARSIVSVNLKDGAITWRSDVAVDQIESTVVSSNGATLYVLGRSSAGADVVSVEIATGSVSKAKTAIGGQHVGVFKSEDGVAVAVSVTADKIAVQSLEADAKSVVTDTSSIATGSDKGKIVLAGLEPSVKHAPVLVLASGKRVYTRIQKTLAVEVGAVLASGGVVTESLTDDATVLHTVASSPAQVEVKTYSFTDQLNHLQWVVDVDVELHGGSVAAVFGGCPQRKKESGVPRCRALLVMKDDDLVMTTNDESESAENARHLLWKRDESLANIKEVQWITPAETEIEKQPLKGIPTFFEELQQESERLKQLVEYVVSASSALLEKKQSDQVVSTKREESVNAHFFGFSKYIVILTESGRLTAIRAETNEVAWSIFVGTGYRLFVTRDHPALGAGAELLLVSNTSKLVWIDGDDGRQIDTDEKKAYGNSWVVLLPKRKHSIDEDASLRRPIALVKRDTLEVTILPKTTAGVSHPEAENFFFSRFDEDSRSFVGYTIDKASNSLYQARVVWSVVLPSEQRLVATSRQRDGAVIDSSVTITGDDSLLLKYLNPHMFGFTSEASETLDGDKKTTPVLYVSLVDAITGRVIHRVRHVHGTGPVHMVQSENWVVYTFWNHKEKRTDLVSLSLFDGAVGSHSLNLWKRPAWNDYRSSYDPRAPFVLQKAFIFPGRIETLGVTVTSRGITPQFVLVGLETGQIFKLNRALIDPRQLEKPPTPQEQEEGLMMYTPLIPLHNHLQSMVTYNQTIANIKTIATTPVELESTTLVFAFGLDLFYVRLAPAKAFDVLPPDFNYELLILLCLGFFGATYVLKSLTLRKSLNEAWK